MNTELALAVAELRFALQHLAECRERVEDLMWNSGDVRGVERPQVVRRHSTRPSQRDHLVVARPPVPSLFDVADGRGMNAAAFTEGAEGQPGPLPRLP